MKATTILSLAALGATATAIPSSATTVATTSLNTTGVDAAYVPTLKLEHFLEYYCSIPGKCTESTGTDLARRGFGWGLNYCRFPGQACPDKRSLSPVAETAALARRGFGWGLNYCRFPGQACPDKRSLMEGGFPGGEALEEGASQGEKNDADRFAHVAELLFGEPSN